jgi:predicted dehydrogenase
MYVCGRDMGGYGTVLPVLAQAQSEGKVGNIHVAATRPESIKILQDQLNSLNKRLGTNCRVNGYPKGVGADPFSYRQALKELARPAWAIVVIPDHLHAPITAEVIRAGLHVLVVKPLTPTIQEGRELIALAEQYKIFGAVEFHKRYDEANLLLRQAILDGRLGDLCYVTVEYSQRRSVPEHAFRSWAAHTNIFQYLGVHYVDLIYFATGARPRRALATAQHHFLKTRGIETPDAVQVLVEWELPEGKTFISSLITHWIDPESTSAMSDQKIAVVGTGGRFESDQKHRGVQLVTETGGIEDINPYFTQIYTGNENRMGVHGYGPRSIRQFLQDICDLCAGRISLDELNSVRPSFVQALVATAVAEAVAKSMQSNSAWVDIPA